MSSASRSETLKTLFPLLAVWVLLLIVYLPTLQTQVNGSQEPYAEDVAEIQTALNLWGTLHATGYPLYAMLGAGFVAVARAIGPAAAPGLFSMVCGLAALGVFYGLIVRLTRRSAVAASAALILGLTRGVWAYSVVAKPYTLTLFFCALLLAIALWPGLDARRRFLLLALVGGFAVAHHRMIAFMGPGLLAAALPPLIREGGRRAIPTLLVALPISLLGFLPYLYLPARAYANAIWVYGDPRTAQGFWNEFTAVEANNLFHLPNGAEGWLADGRDTLDIALSQITPIGTALAVGIGIVALVRRKQAYRSQIGIAALCGLGFIAFVLVLHRVVMPQAVVMPAVLFLLFGAALALHNLATRWLLALTGIAMLALVALNFTYIYQMAHDDSGLKLIALASTTPANGIFMEPWSTAYNDVAFSKYVTGENATLRIADHKADFKALRAQGSVIYTPRDTFYRFPLAWWDQSGKAYLSAADGGLIAIRTAPISLMEPPKTSVGFGIGIADAGLSCSAGQIDLQIDWAADRVPDRDLSVFVHLIGTDPAQVLATGDQSAPVYGWYPTTRWSAGEIIRDRYNLPDLPGGTAVKVGMYEQPTPGHFINYGEMLIPLKGGRGCATN